MISSPDEIFTKSEPYFIADIAANHDGDLERAVALIHLAAEAGANAAKFQNFQAHTIVSDFGFRSLGGKLSHQAQWEKSVYEVYEAASLPLEWSEVLAKACLDAGIEFMSTPYSIELADHLNPFVRAFKIGSGDITFLDLISHVAGFGKPWMLATGASTLDEVRAAVHATQGNQRGVLMQCNTNYTGDAENLRYINLKVLKTYEKEFPDVVLGLSDHTLGDVTVIGAASLGARVFEKHFTDDRSRNGPDHGFSMMPQEWRDMVRRTQDLMSSLGDGIKKVEENELDTVVVQRRALRAKRGLQSGHIIEESDFVSLRPAPIGSLAPYELSGLVGRELSKNLEEGDHISWSHLK